MSNNEKKPFSAGLLQKRIAAMKAAQNQPAATQKVDAPVVAKPAQTQKVENAKPAVAPKDIRVSSTAQVFRKAHLNKGSLHNILAYWFPIIIVLGLVAFAVYHFAGGSKPRDNVSKVDEIVAPTFDMVRTQPGGGLVVAGKFLPASKVQIEINKKVVGKETGNDKGEFAFSSPKKFKPGNYIIRLLNEDGSIASKDSVFVYIASEKNGASLSLLMTETGSKFLQAPDISDGSLAIKKIDYLDGGRVRISGRGLPRLNVTATLDGKVVGAAKVGDDKSFGIDGDFADFRADRDYTIEVKMTDDLGNMVEVISHKFNLPESRDGEASYYTVKRGDCLWIISRHKYGRGILYTQIFEANTAKIKDPHWIYPKQVFVLPAKK
ncbi:MAG: LysM peptidoglycan-binding domain-containing protein [Rickettsiales bacterium]|jgi:hypothetical protein|nr:LysM peptidoglycan-binding domain-containing protein [Rickettsiales bacterium]